MDFGDRGLWGDTQIQAYWDYSAVGQKKACTWITVTQVRITNGHTVSEEMWLEIKIEGH